MEVLYNLIIYTYILFTTIVSERFLIYVLILIVNGFSTRRSIYSTQILKYMPLWLPPTLLADGIFKDNRSNSFYPYFIRENLMTSTNTISLFLVPAISRSHLIKTFRYYSGDERTKQFLFCGHKYCLL